jgi:predicted thioesterase
MIGRASLVVAAGQLAPAMKTGSVKVLSSAILAALMEEAACDAIKGECAKLGRASVGTKFNLAHKKPSALGANVTAVALVEKLDARAIIFKIEARDETGVVGTADHTRVFVRHDDFEKKCYEAARSARSSAVGG